MSSFRCLVTATALLAPALALAAPAPTLAVDVSAARHPISDDIYGMNYADGILAAELRLPVDRWGGDATSRYNWQVDATNAGDDFYYMAGGEATTAVPGATADAFVQKDRDAGARTLLTIPLIPYLNNAVHWDCSYPRSQFPLQQAYNPYIHPNGDDCGNSRLVSDGTSIRLTEQQILRIHVRNDPSIAQGWMQHLLGKFGPAAQGGVKFLDLDNEPSGWSNTHRDVAPDTWSYETDGGVPGLTALGLTYARAVKAVDPGVQILGPVDFGYPVYGHAGAYLDAFAADQAAHGVRLLDYLDEHYYPASCPANTSDPGTADDQARRLRATRSLWDPSWEDESWIGQYYPPIQLIPSFKALIAQHYPGTKLAITEYNFGGIGSINGALTQADVLGIFGREGLDLATMWGPPGTGDPVAYVFRLYRNYDGQRHGFGEISVSATTADSDAVSIYAAQRASDGALTVLLANKTAAVATGPLSLSGVAAGAAVQIWTYGPANLGAIVRQPDASVTAGSVALNIPAQTLVLLVIATATGSSPDGGQTAPDGGPPVSGADGGATAGTGSPTADAVQGVTCAVSGGGAEGGGLALAAVALAVLLRRRGRHSPSERA